CATPIYEIYTLSLHDALPILLDEAGVIGHSILQIRDALNRGTADRLIIIPYNNFVTSPIIMSKYIYQELGIPYFENHNPNHVPRSEEHTSELQSRENLVCRLL